MKIKKILAAVAATAVAISTMALNAFAADIWTGSNDVGTDWNGDNALKIDGSLFADTKGGDTVEIVYTTNEDSGLCLKIIENTNGWPVLDSPEGKDPQWSTIGVEAGSTSYSFVISADDVARIQGSGMVIQGVGVTITKVAVTGAAAEEAAPAEEAAAEEAAPEEEAAAPEEAEAEDVDVESEEEADEPETEAEPVAETEEAPAVADAQTGSEAPKTGNTAAASMIAVMAAAGVAAVVSKKRK